MRSHIFCKAAKRLRTGRIWECTTNFSKLCQIPLPMVYACPTVWSEVSASESSTRKPLCWSSQNKDATCSRAAAATLSQSHSWLYRQRDSMCCRHAGAPESCTSRWPGSEPWLRTLTLTGCSPMSSMMVNFSLAVLSASGDTSAKVQQEAVVRRQGEASVVLQAARSSSQLQVAGTAWSWLLHISGNRRYGTRASPHDCCREAGNQQIECKVAAMHMLAACRNQAQRSAHLHRPGDAMGTYRMLSPVSPCTA